MNPAIKFTKMHGLGNDFVVINALSKTFTPEASFIKKIADRHTGIGFDQLLLLGSSDSADFSCQFFNSDGSEAETCGNGLRCLARFIREEKLSNKNSLTIETKKRTIKIDILDSHSIQVDMGIPKILSPCHLQINKNDYHMFVLSMDNPHAILIVDQISNDLLEKIGPTISTHPQFPHGINVGFMKIKSPDCIKLQTFERGAGATLACGSNSCAAVVAGIENKLLSNSVTVELPLGNLLVKWEGAGKPVYLSGSAEKSFEGFLFSKNFSF